MRADAYLILGAANYIIGSLPALKRFFLHFKGISGYQYHPSPNLDGRRSRPSQQNKGKGKQQKSQKEDNGQKNSNQ